jgi:hypothetical protein
MLEAATSATCMKLVSGEGQSLAFGIRTHFIVSVPYTATRTQDFLSGEVKVKHIVHEIIDQMIAMRDTGL